MAPLGITTRLLLERGLNAFGLCELPLLTLEAWLSRIGGSLDGATWCYGGLNHLGWFWNVRLDNKDVLQMLADVPVQGDPTPVDKITVEKYQAAPLRYFYEVFDREAGARLGMVRSPNRARHLMDLSERLVERFSSEPGTEMGVGEFRPTPWLDRAVAPIASALLGGPIHQGFVNLRNGTHIPELPPDIVVEVAATFTSRGASSVAPGPLPEPVARFLNSMAQAELLTYRAAHEHDTGLLEVAIRALPYPISEREVQQLASLAKAGPPQERR
jgi:alpha-galactosidase/6-phospho-beta-glucosidase family protein